MKHCELSPSLPFVGANATTNRQALVCVRVVCRHGHEALSLPHVVAALRDFLDWSKEVSLSRACEQILCLSFARSLPATRWSLLTALAHIRHADYDAAKKGRLDIVKLLHSNNIDGCTRTAIQIAAARGHLDVVKWMLLCKHKKLAGIRTRRTMDCAAESGDLEMVKWLHKNTRKTCSTPAMDRAASSGHLDVVQYLHENRSEGCSTSAMDDAARNGNLQIVQWLSENRTEGCTTRAMDYAAAGGHIEVVKWLHDNRHEGCTINAMNYAAKNGHLDVVKCLHLNRTEGCTTEAMDGAAGSCYLDVVLWLSENRSESCTTLTLDHAARNGYQNMVEWLLRNSSEGGTAATMASIAARGNIEEVYWCHFVARVPYDASAIDAAVLNSRFAVAWFLHEHRESNGCDIVRALIECPKSNRRCKFTEWMYSHHRCKLKSMAGDIFADS
ncbi:hypothetical protein F444_20775 [Phytophthora nicotianae P1976]|uniref:Uncharacterized protein n=1 Tax=Phytophthora nicotianae P1976 TaxID=1317066 RepID=A0A080Z3H2_PHYNI|nr:hypothetical protein F444_20775 [Phytophthora nicotianae P1976]